VDETVDERTLFVRGGMAQASDAKKPSIALVAKPGKVFSHTFIALLKFLFCGGILHYVLYGCVVVVHDGLQYSLFFLQDVFSLAVDPYTLFGTLFIVADIHHRLW